MNNQKDNSKLFVGQVLYLKDKTGPIEVVVKSIGRKYFYLEGWRSIYPIEKSTLSYIDKKYTQSSFKLYKTIDEINDLEERKKIANALVNHFQWYSEHKKNSLDQLRKVAEILGIQTNAVK